MRQPSTSISPSAKTGGNNAGIAAEARIAFHSGPRRMTCNALRDKFVETAK